MAVVKILVHTMKTSNGYDYYVDIVNDRGENMSINIFRIVGHANYSAKDYADFMEIPFEFARVTENICPSCEGTGTDEEVSIMGCRECDNTGKKLEN